MRVKITFRVKVTVRIYVNVTIRPTSRSESVSGQTSMSESGRIRVKVMIRVIG